MRGLIALWLLIGLSMPASAERPRLLVIGDSLAAGLYATSQDAGFAWQLAGMLNADLGVLRVATVEQARAALPGWRWTPDWMVIELGLNDASHGVALTAYRDGYAALLDDAQSRWPDARVIVATLFAGMGETDLRRHYSAELRILARERGLSLADIAAATANCQCVAPIGSPSPFPPGYAGDGWHPGDAGHRLIAKTLAQTIQSMVFLPALVQ